MTVLVITSSFPRYDGDYFGPWILTYVREMVAQGCKVIVVAPQVGDAEKEVLSDENLIVKRFSYWWPNKSQCLVHPPGIMPQIKSYPWLIFQLPFLLWNYWKMTKRVMMEYEVDIIHTQWVIPGGFIGAFAKRKFKKPLVVTSQGAEFYMPRWHLFSWVTKWTLGQIDKLLPVSQMMANRALGYGAIKEQMVVIPNAVDTNIFNPNVRSIFREGHGIPEDAIVLLTIRRLVSEKRVEDVIAAYNNVCQNTEKDIWLIIGGDGPERIALERQARLSSAADKIIFIGFVDNTALPQIYNASDIYILSSAQEGLSLSLLEAMACGAWVISTATTGANEVINDGVNGALYKVGEIDELTDKIRDRMNERSSKISLLPKDYNVSDMIRRTVDVYGSLLMNFKE